MIELWNDGTGLKPVTDIDRALWLSFYRFDSIVSEAKRQLDRIITHQ
jgi:hypothetical protein